MTAAFYLVLYTMFGSFFLLCGLLLLFLFAGSTNWLFLLYSNLVLPWDVQYILWPFFFFAFAIKIPMVPFHLWLPEAHVEAPTGASVLLAAIILKLGGYGLLRFLLPLFPQATYYYSPIIIILCILGALYASLAALRQIDLKRVIAYSSVAHMNFALVGVFTCLSESFFGFYLVMLGHGFISAALFFIVGILYDRAHSRVFYYYTNLSQRMPLFSVFFFFFIISNVGFPGTINYLGELFIVYGLTVSSFYVLVVGLLVLFVSVVFSFWIFNRTVFGTSRLANAFVFMYDLTLYESLLLTAFMVPTLFFGLFPHSLSSSLFYSFYV